MTILVAYASRHGATAGIAERIAVTLTESGRPAQARPVEEVTSLDGYDGVILGAAAYMFHWLKPAVKFARKHQVALARLPVWLFSSGPLGTDLVDKDGKDIVQASRPKEFDELIELLDARGTQIFFGAFDPDAEPVGLGERMVRHMPAARDAMPAGDFRDWAAIDTWARGIAEAIGSDDTHPE